MMQLPDCLEPPDDESIWAPPLDIFDVAVRLETAGVTDRVAREDYGHRDTLELAEICFPPLKTRGATGSKLVPPPDALTEYFKGVSFGFPLLLCAIAMFVFRFSLWGGDVTAEVAAAVGVGTISSFIVTGGFVLAMGRRCTFLLNALEGRGATSLCAKWTGWAIAALAVSALALIGASAYFYWFPWPLAFVLVGFHMALGLLWVASGLLHTLERNSMILSACAIGLTTVLACHFGAGVPVLAAQIIGIPVAAGCAFRTAYLALQKYPLATSSQTKETMDVYVTSPYFAFGALYYLFLFADRILAWTVPDLSASLEIVFRGDYETGLDLSLIAFVLAAGAVRPGVVFFFHHLEAAAREVHLFYRNDFCMAMRRYYLVQCYRIGGCAAVISVGVGAAAYVLLDRTDLRTMHVLFWSLCSVPWIVIGLWNTNVQFRLSRPWDALLSIAPAILVDLCNGYILTRMGGYQFAAVGLALGALTFGILSCLLTHQRLRALDFENYGSAI